MSVIVYTYHYSEQKVTWTAIWGLPLQRGFTGSVKILRVAL